MKSFKERCVELRKQDKSIGEIVEITGRSKSSIYPHIKDIPLSKNRIEKYHNDAAKHIRRFALKRKGKSVRPFHHFDIWTPDLVRLVGHLAFDGEISLKRGCAYNNRSEALIERVEQLMEVIYDFEPKRWQNKLTGVRRISYYNVALANYLNDKRKELVRGIKKLPLPSKRAFLEAFFDDEGCVDYRPNENKRSIRGYQKDVSILKLIQKLLADFSVEARVVLPNEVQIVGKKNLSRFEKEINFSFGIYMNGNRANSRWKKDIEKRKLLRKAIESYKS